MTATAPHLPHARARRSVRAFTATLAAVGLVVGAVVASRCAPEAYVDVTVGPLAAELDVPVSEIPAALIATDGTLLRISCDGAQACPQPTGIDVVVECASGACALSTTATATTEVVDLDDYATFRDFSSMLNRVGVDRAVLRVSGLPRGLAIGPLDLWWSAPSDSSKAAGANAEHPLGTFPRIEGADGERSFDLVVDAEGARALSDSVRSGDRRFRFRAEGPIRIASGLSVPPARLPGDLTLILVIHAEL